VGVKILEGNKQKFGGNDFSAVFHRPSKYDYLSLMKESVNITVANSLVYNKEPASQSMDFSLRRENRLPSINKTNLSNNEKSLLKSIQANNNGSNESMVLGRRISSLKNSLDKLDLMPQYEEKLQNPLLRNNKDIFKNRKSSFEKEKSINKRNSIESSLSNINSFNYSIVKNPQWGNVVDSKNKQEFSREGSKSPHKPSQREFEIELGN
jgi:hypothetical protein